MNCPTVAELTSLIASNINAMEAAWAQADMMRESTINPARAAELFEEYAAELAEEIRLLQMRRDGIARARRINLRERLAR